MLPHFPPQASPDNDEHIVTSGRWAYTPILSDASAFSRFTNPYGLLRSPWNTNPTPYFTRYHYLFGTDSFYWPTCEHFSVRRSRISLLLYPPPPSSKHTHTTSETILQLKGDL